MVGSASSLYTLPVAVHRGEGGASLMIADHASDPRAWVRIPVTATMRSLLKRWLRAGEVPMRTTFSYAFRDAAGHDCGIWSMTRVDGRVWLTVSLHSVVIACHWLTVAQWAWLAGEIGGLV